MPVVDELSLVLSVQDGNFIAKLQSANQQVTLFNGNIQNLQSTLSNLGQTIAGNKPTNPGAGLAKVATAANQAGQALKGYPAVVAPVVAANNQMATGFGTAAASLAALAFTMGSFFSKAQQEFVKFEDALVGVRRVIDQLDDGQVLDAFKRDILELSQRLPLASSELLKIAEGLGQLGLFANTSKDQVNQAVLGMTEQVAKFAAVTGLSTEAAGKSFGTLQNIFLSSENSIDGAGDGLKRFADAAVDLARKTTATGPSIIEFAQNVGATATTLGLSFEQVSGFGAAISKLGVTANVAGTAFQHFLQDLTNKSQVFADVLRISNDEFKALVEQRPNDTIIRFFEEFNTLTAARRAEVLKLLGAEQRYSKVIQGLASTIPNVATAQDIATKAAQEGTATQLAYNKVNEAFSTQLTLLANTINNTLIKAFDTLKPILTPIIQGIRQFIESFPVSSTVVAAFGVAIAGVAAVLATLALVLPRISQGFLILTGQMAGTNIAAISLQRSLALLNLTGIAGVSTFAGMAKGLKAMTAAMIASATAGKGLSLLLGGALVVGTVAFAAALASVVIEINAADKAFQQAFQSGNLNDQLEAAKKLQKSSEDLSKSWLRFVPFVNVALKTAANNAAEITHASAEALAVQLRAFDSILANAGKGANARAQEISAATARIAADLQKQIGDVGKTQRLLTSISTVNDLEKLHKQFGINLNDLALLARSIDDVSGRTVDSQDSLERGFEKFIVLKNGQKDLENATLQIQKEQADTLKEVEQLAKRYGDDLVAAGNESDGLSTKELARAKTIADQRAGSAQLTKEYEKQRDTLIGAIKALGGSVAVTRDGLAQVPDLTKVSAENIKRAEEFQTALNTAVQNETLQRKGLVRLIEQEKIAESERQKALRETIESVEDLALSEKQQVAENTNDRLSQIKFLQEKESQAVRRLIDARNSGRDKDLQDERVFATRKLLIVAQTEAQVNKILIEAAAERQKNNLELEQQLRSLQDTNNLTGPSANLDQLQAIFEEMRKINAQVADEELKLKVINELNEKAKLTLGQTNTAQLEAQIKLNKFNRERNALVRDRLQLEQQAAEKNFIQQRQALNLNTDAGRKQLRVLTQEKALADLTAEANKDKLLTAEEIDRIEAKQLEVAQARANTNTAAGRKELADAQELIRLEADQQKQRLRDIDNRTAAEIDARRKSQLEAAKARIDKLGFDPVSAREEFLREAKVINDAAQKSLDQLGVREEVDPAIQRQELERELALATDAANQAEQRFQELFGEGNDAIDERIKRLKELSTVEQGRAIQETLPQLPNQPGTDRLEQGLTQDALDQLSKAPLGDLSKLLGDRINGILSEVKLSSDSAATNISQSLGNVDAAVQGISTAFSLSTSSLATSADKVQTSAQQLSGNLGGFMDQAESTLDRINRSITELNVAVETSRRRLEDLTSSEKLLE